MIKLLSKYWKYIIAFIGGIGSVIGILVLSTFRNGKEYEKIDQFNKENKLKEGKQKDEKIISGYKSSNYNNDGTIR